MKRKHGSKHSISYLTRFLKSIGKSVAKRNPAALARQVMSHKCVKKEVLKLVGKLIQKDMKLLCRVKVPSILRKRSANAMSSFTWEQLVDEVRNTAPFLHQIVSMCVQRKRRQMSKKGKTYAANDDSVVSLIVTILLRHRNENLNLIQRIVSILLYCGHAPKMGGSYNYIILLFLYNIVYKYYRFIDVCKSCMSAFLINQLFGLLTCWESLMISQCSAGRIN